MAMTKADMLADAQQKLHLLQTGRLSVEVIADGYVVKYTRATIPELKAYIRDLQAELTGSPIGGAIVPIWSR
jgi:hypothetical protein